MIEVNIIGQLGNQLFEYACARQLQEIYGGKIVLNTYEMSKIMPNFELQLLDYNLNPDIEVENKKTLSAANAEKISVKVLRRYFSNLYFSFMARKGVFVWKSARVYKKLPKLKKSISKHIVLNGYWQCGKYFEGISEKLKAELTPKQGLLEHNVDLFNKIRNTNSVCVTIRRGDFLNHKNKKTFYVCDNQYFKEGMELILQKIPDCTFFAFSDDIEWVKKNLKFPGKVYYECGTDPVWEKLRLMSSCKNFILSNSSFSWWAQYLSDNSHKIVIAPDKWYNIGKSVKADIYQNNWDLVHIDRK